MTSIKYILSYLVELEKEVIVINVKIPFNFHIVTLSLLHYFIHIIRKI